MKKALIENLIKNIEPSLNELGFRYIKSTQCFEKKSDEYILTLHLNFGLDLININLSIRYTKLMKSVPIDIRQYAKYSFLLNQVMDDRKIFKLSDNDSWETLLDAILHKGLPMLEKLQNFEFLLNLLNGNTIEKIDIAFSNLIRILPLVYFQLQRYDDSINTMNRFLNQLGKDQIIPKYDFFYKILQEHIRIKTTRNG